MIIIDLRMLHFSGIGVYQQNLMPLVIDAFPETDFELRGNAKELAHHQWTKAGNIGVSDYRQPIFSLREQLYPVTRRQKDLLWIPHFNIPVFHTGKILVTVHDVFHLALPEQVGGIHKRLYAKGIFKAIEKKADKIICVSEFTARELTNLTRITADRIEIIHNGINEKWFHVKKEKPPSANPYLLFVGNVKPNKNLSALLTAFQNIANQIPHDLIIAGQEQGFRTGDLQVLRQISSLRPRVRFTGYLERATLEQYFAHAEALVFPSIYEGFGFPPLEAMACGCPVIVSNAASLPEVCGDAALYFHPKDTDHIAGTIKTLVDDRLLRQHLREKGIERAKRFTWENTAQKTARIIAQLR